MPRLRRGTPAWRAAASAASAFMRLCSPMSGQRTVPCSRRRAARRTNRRGGPLPTLQAWPGAEALDRRPAPRASTRSSAASCAVHHQPSLGGHDAHEVVELGLDRGQVREDVGVVVLEVAQDRGARAVPDELGALVEEGGVVLVGLDHEEGRVGRARRDVEVARDAADEEPRVEAGVLRGSRRASRRSCSCRGCPPPRAPTCPRSTCSAEPLRARRRRAARGRGSPRPRLAARHRVADHVEIGRVAIELRGVVALVQRRCRAPRSCSLIGG